LAPTADTKPVVEKGKFIWMNGTMVPWDDAKVHVLTHTLHYGVGAFEGIRCYECADGRSAVFRLREHIVRLVQSCNILGIESPYGVDALVEGCVATIRANELKACYIRPLVYVADGEMGLGSAVVNPIHVSIAVWPWGSYLGDEGLANGIRVRTSSFQRMHVNTLMTKAKAVGHYVNSILASNEARRGGYDEALMLDVDGYVSEASGENLFIVTKGVVRTPPLPTVLAGITRASVLALLADAGVPAREERLTRDEIYLADEAFFTGTAVEVTPVRELDDRRIGTGAPGPITKRLQDLFFRVVQGREERYRSWLAPV
jgi:branched-chain amino acid aminotransferase